MEELVKPKRYNSHPSGVECKEISNKVVGLFSSVTRYLFRWEYKDPLGSLTKALVYLGDVDTEIFDEIFQSVHFPESKINDVLICSRGDILLTRLMNVMLEARAGNYDFAFSELDLLKGDLEAQIKKLENAKEIG